MKFQLIDRIVELVPQERIVAVKAVSLAEEYLSDHFPTYPVMPGVLMLEALAEAAAWLVREAHDFAASIYLLCGARNVVFKRFVKPGNLLTVEATCRRLARGESDFEGVGYCNEEEVVKARFGLTHFRLADREGSLEPLDRQLIAGARAQFARLRR